MKSVDASDRRVFGRRRTDIRASVRAGNRVIPCLITDIAEGGAHLEFSEPVQLPSRLWLTLPGHGGDISCEVRHSTRNSAGVQFSRPVALPMRGAVSTGEAKPLPAPAPALRAPEPVSSSLTAADLVAQRRRQHAPSSAEAQSIPVAAAPSKQGHVQHTPLSQPEPPRDLSSLVASLHREAAAIVEKRLADLVPKPCPPSLYAQAPVQPLSLPEPVGAVRPMPAAAFAGAAVTPHPLALWTGTVPAPLPAYGLAVPEPENIIDASKSRALADVLLADDEGSAAFAVWRNLANLPPRPLAASAYREIDTVAAAAPASMVA